MVTQVISDYARTFGLKSLRNQKQKLSGTLSYKVGFKTLQVQSTECSHAYSKKAGEQCPSIGRVTAPYEICHSLKSSCFTWLHTLAALIAPHHSGLPLVLFPGILQASFTWNCSLICLQHVPSACLIWFFLHQLIIQQLARCPAIIHFLHLRSPVELHWSKHNFTAVGLAPFQGHVLVDELQPARLPKINGKQVSDIQHFRK